MADEDKAEGKEPEGTEEDESGVVVGGGSLRGRFEGVAICVFFLNLLDLPENARGWDINRELEDNICGPSWIRAGEAGASRMAEVAAEDEPRDRPGCRSAPICRDRNHSSEAPNRHKAVPCSCSVELPHTRHARHTRHFFIIRGLRWDVSGCGE